MPKTTSDAIVALQTDPKFANIKDNWVVKSAPSPDAGAAGAGDKAAPEGLEAQIQKLSEQVAAIAKGIEAPGKDLGANWQEGPNWKGGHDSYLLVDQVCQLAHQCAVALMLIDLPGVQDMSPQEG